MLIHGWDIARGSGLEWIIPANLARLAIEGCIVPTLHGLAGTEARELETSAACEIRLRGGGRFVLALTAAGLAVNPSCDRVDLHIAADPAAMLLGMSGRGGSR